MLIQLKDIERFKVDFCENFMTDFSLDTGQYGIKVNTSQYCL